MNLNLEIQKRIFDAADQLHQDSGRADFPTVDAVRRKARTNMNDASAAMKAWRALQTTTASAPVASIPDAIQRISQDGLNAIWSAAQEPAFGTSGLGCGTDRGGNRACTNVCCV